MNYSEGKKLFIEEWGKLGVNWGTNKTMAHIHAYLLMCKEPVCAEKIRTYFDISSGNTNMNLRELMEWGLVFKSKKEGERKDFYFAEKEMWKIFTQIVNNRKKRELDPMIKMLSEVSEVKGLCEESKEFCTVVNELKLFSSRADAMLDKITHPNSNWLVNGMMKIIR